MLNPKESKKIEVKLPENVPIDYNFERLLKSFTRQIEKSGILQEVKARRYYRKPSEIKRTEKKKRERKN